MDLAEYIRKVASGEMQYNKDEAKTVLKANPEFVDKRPRDKKDTSSHGEVIERNGDIVTVYGIKKDSYTKCPKHKLFDRCSFADIKTGYEMRIDIAEHWMHYSKTEEIQSDWFIDGISPLYRINLVTAYDASVAIAKVVYNGKPSAVKKASEGKLRYMTVNNVTPVKKELLQLAIVEISDEPRKIKVMLNNFVKNYKYIDSLQVEREIAEKLKDVVRFK